MVENQFIFCLFIDFKNGCCIIDILILVPYQLLKQCPYGYVAVPMQNGKQPFVSAIMYWSDSIKNGLTKY